MIALAQGTAGIALVTGFALLCMRQISAASILLAAQSASVALCAILSHLPLLALPPLLLAAGIRFALPHLADPDQPPPSDNFTRLTAGAGAALTALCQGQGALALPLALVLLSVLLATARQHSWMQAMALVGLQNGIVLAACLTTHDGAWPTALLAAACSLLPLPLAIATLAPALTRLNSDKTVWPGWIDVGLSLAVFAATLLIPLDSTASVFAPLLAMDGVMLSCRRRKRSALTPAGRGVALLQGAFPLLAVGWPDPVVAWLGIFGSVAASLLPSLPRRGDHALLAFVAAGVSLFGLLHLGHSVVAYFSVFAGFLAIAAVIPNLAVVLVILLFRIANQTPWPPAAGSLGLATALLALLACAGLLQDKSPRSAVPLLQQGQASVAALSVCLGSADGRFAALVLLVLVVLTRSSARVANGPFAGLAVAGLGGVPPLGVFPGLVLVVLAIISHDAWLLLPLGAAAVPILGASLPRHLPTLSRQAAKPSLGWLPFALAILCGYFAPESLVRWWHLLTAGQG